MLSKTESRSGLLRGFRGEKADLRAEGTNPAFVIINPDIFKRPAAWCKQDSA